MGCESKSSDGNPSHTLLCFTFYDSFFFRAGYALCCVCKIWRFLCRWTL